MRSVITRNKKLEIVEYELHKLTIEMKQNFLGQ